MSLLVDIKKRFGSFLLDVSFEAADGVLGLLGASGCGKSVTLKCVAGIVRPDEGRIVLDGRVLFDSGRRIDLPPQERRVGYLFQQYALFPNMTVEKNVAAGARHLPRAERRAAVAAMLEKMQLSGVSKKYPSQLSGGQQQRTALGRILINEPRALLLDEPFAALDSHLRDRMQREVMEVMRDFSGPALLVSHSRDEIFRMADNVAVYSAGRIDAIGEKHALFYEPGTYTAALLTGCKNFSRVSGLRHEGGRTVFFAEDWGVELSVPGEREGGLVGLRRHHVQLAGRPGENAFEMEVVSVLEDAFECTLFLRRPGFGGEPLGWAVPKEVCRALPPGPLRIRFPDEALMLLTFSREKK